MRFVRLSLRVDIQQVRCIHPAGCIRLYNSYIRILLLCLRVLRCAVRLVAQCRPYPVFFCPREAEMNGGAGGDHHHGICVKL